MLMLLNVACVLLKGCGGSGRPFKTGEPRKLGAEHSLVLESTCCGWMDGLINGWMNGWMYSFSWFSQAGLLGILAVAEHAGEFDKIIQLSQR